MYFNLLQPSLLSMETLLSKGERTRGPDCDIDWDVDGLGGVLCLAYTQPKVLLPAVQHDPACQCAAVCLQASDISQA